jgi:hypothetical protein
MAKEEERGGVASAESDSDAALLKEEDDDAGVDHRLFDLLLDAPASAALSSSVVASVVGVVGTVVGKTSKVARRRSSKADFRSSKRRDQRWSELQKVTTKTRYLVFSWSTVKRPRRPSNQAITSSSWNLWWLMRWRFYDCVPNLFRLFLVNADKGRIRTPHSFEARRAPAV